MSGEVGEDTGKGAGFGTVGGEMRGVEGRKVKAVKRGIGGFMIESNRKT